LISIPLYGHEVGTHGHDHDWNEMDSLGRGRGKEIAFLRQSKNAFEDFFGVAPTCFRSPCWCVLGEGALDELEALGYLVDSSSTPQRLSVFSSRPYSASWTFASRKPYWIRKHLLEIPMTSLGVPAGSPTFSTLRRCISSIFIKLALIESLLSQETIVNVQFHVSDLCPNMHRKRVRERIRPTDFALRRRGGFSFKYHLRQTDEAEIWKTSHALLSLLEGQARLTLSGIRTRFMEYPSDSKQPSIALE